MARLVTTNMALPAENLVAINGGVSSGLKLCSRTRTHDNILHVEYDKKHFLVFDCRMEGHKIHIGLREFSSLLHIYASIIRKAIKVLLRAPLRVTSHLHNALRWGNPTKCLFQLHNKEIRRLFPHCPFNAKRQAVKM